MFKIMVVEDDKKICSILLENIQKWGYEGVAVERFDDVLGEFARQDPHLILLDINLPQYDGYYWCSQIRSCSKVPILFLSSRATNMDIIMAVNMGGDDYVTKPFSLEVLMAKVNALLRRTYAYTDADLYLLEHRGVILNRRDDTLTVFGEKLELTRNEYKILQLLMENHGTIIERDRLMRHLWQHESFVDDNTLTVNINRLRKKLKDVGLEDYIVTKKNAGYLIP